ncbi:MAG TPA: hypothetical protein VKS21_10760 [Spirochaetota bacterium]|nr:hypothetical protein [Spirochaetota bacterium]
MNSKFYIFFLLASFVFGDEIISFKDYSDINITSSVEGTNKKSYYFKISPQQPVKRKHDFYRFYRDELDQVRKIVKYEVFPDKTLQLDFSRKGQLLVQSRFKADKIKEKIIFTRQGVLSRIKHFTKKATYEEHYLYDSDKLLTKNKYINDELTARESYIYSQDKLRRINIYNSRSKLDSYILINLRNYDLPLGKERVDIAIRERKYFKADHTLFKEKVEYYFSNRLTAVKNKYQGTRAYFIYRSQSRPVMKMLVDARLGIRKKDTRYFYFKKKKKRTGIDIMEDKIMTAMTMENFYDAYGTNFANRLRVYNNDYILIEQLSSTDRGRGIMLQKKLRDDIHYKLHYNADGMITGKIMLDKNYKLLGKYIYSYNRQKKLQKVIFLNAEGKIQRKIKYFYDPDKENGYTNYLQQEINSYGTEAGYFTGRSLFKILKQEAADPNNAILPEKYSNYKNKQLQVIKNIYNTGLVKIIFYNTPHNITHYIRIKTVKSNNKIFCYFKYYSRKIDFAFREKPDWEYYRKNPNVCLKNKKQSLTDAAGRQQDFESCSFDKAGAGMGRTREHLQTSIVFEFTPQWDFLAATKEAYNSHSSTLLARTRVDVNGVHRHFIKDDMEQMVDDYISNTADFSVNEPQPPANVSFPWD